MYFTTGTKSFIAFKVITDTAVFGPLHIAAFFSYMVLMEGGSWKVGVWCGGMVCGVWCGGMV